MLGLKDMRSGYLMLALIALIVIVGAGYTFGKATAPVARPKGLLGVGLDLGFVKL